MGFMVTSLIFLVTGIIASLCTRICCNRGASTNLLHLTLVLTATVCCWMMHSFFAAKRCEHVYDVGNCLPCANETAYCTYLE